MLSHNLLYLCHAREYHCLSHTTLELLQKIKDNNRLSRAIDY